MDTGNKILIGGIAVVVIGFLLTRNAGQDTPPGTEQSNDPVTSPPIVQPINENLVLANGSRGQEVAKLQSLLGVVSDGIFGNVTENALYAKKGVKQVSLKQYATLANVVHGTLKIGDRVMANKKPGTQTYENLTLANGTYSNTGAPDDEVAFGQEIGTIIAIPLDKVNYVVQRSGWFSGIVWVRAAEVAKI